MTERDVNLWTSAEHALDYLAKADAIPHRTQGEAVLPECRPPFVSRVLDLGSGDGPLLGLVKLARPVKAAVALDFSSIMIERLHARVSGDPSVEVMTHDLDEPLPESLGTFDAVVSSFSIHHLLHERKRELYQEIFSMLSPGGIFCNFEHVASASVRRH